METALLLLCPSPSSRMAPRRGDARPPGWCDAAVCTVLVRSVDFTLLVAGQLSALVRRTGGAFVVLEVVAAGPRPRRSRRVRVAEMRGGETRGFCAKLQRGVGHVRARAKKPVHCMLRAQRP